MDCTYVDRQLFYAGKGGVGRREFFIMSGDESACIHRLPMDMMMQCRADLRRYAVVPLGSTSRSTRRAAMSTQFDFKITTQPDETTCGPACLHAVYRYYGQDIAVEQVSREVQRVSGGGTLAVMLGLHALENGYNATIYTCDLVMFDPSWFGQAKPLLQERLRAQAEVKDDSKFVEATQAYLEFLDSGGKVRMEDITADLIYPYLDRRIPVIVGLSATWLYRCKRERPGDQEFDDIQGVPTGHFVVVHGVDRAARTVTIADPYCHEPFPGSHRYTVDMDHLIAAIMLGIVTFDAKLLIVTPQEST